MKLNTKLHATFRRYNPNIPAYLTQRPHYTINHCLEKRSTAESIPSSHVEAIDLTNGVFTVRSQSSMEDKQSYRVQFGTDQPSCECYDWERQRLPCKHFFAVFRHFSSWSFDNLLGPYKDSPFFTLDEELFMPEYASARENILQEPSESKPATSTQQPAPAPAPAPTFSTQIPAPEPGKQPVPASGTQAPASYRCILLCICSYHGIGNV